jgi:hypothetical protein
MAQLPNCTCLATLTRFHREAGSRRKLQFLDTVRLEVVYSNGREWYSSPGEVNRSTQDPVTFIGAGMIANGIFGITMHNLFVSDAATFKYHGGSAADAGIVEYDFQLPSLGHHGVHIFIPEGTATVSEKDSFEADRNTLDVVRLEIQVTEIPAFLPLSNADFNVVYAHTRIGEFDAVLPQQADLHMLLASGVEDYDRIDFTHCRTFESHSAIRFDVPDSGDPISESPRLQKPREEPSIPPFLLVAIRTTKPITNEDSVGQVIEGRVAGDVRRNGKVLIQNGAIVHGRIRRLDRSVSGHFIVGLEFTDVETASLSMRFYADLIKLEKRKGIQPALRETLELPDQSLRFMDLAVPELPGVASFFVDGKTFVLPAGFQTIWRTRSLLRGY